ncbi:MAG: glycosyltransferase family 4 protein [Myxococcota bacterium]
MPTDKPTVVVVGPFSTSAAGGVVTFQRNLIEKSNLSEQWNFVRFSTARPPKESVNNNYSYGAIFNSGIRRAIKGVAITAWHIATFIAVLRRHDATVVQIQSSDFYNFWEGMIYIAQAHAVGVPAVIRFGGDFEHFYTISSPRAQKIITRLLKTPDNIVCQSEGWKSYFSTLTDADRLHVVGNAVPPPPPPPDRTVRTGPPELMFICTADAKRKGVDAILEMAPKLRGRAKMTFIATPDPIQQRVRDMGLDDLIEMHGSITPTEIVGFYRRADIFLLPSFSEGFPNAMLEAMAAALPYVGSPVGAVPEVINDGVEGLLVPAGDAEALTKATMALVDDPQRRRTMGAAAYRKVSEEYELNIMFSRFNRIWRQAIDRHTSQ